MKRECHDQFDSSVSLGRIRRLLRFKDERVLVFRSQFGPCLPMKRYKVLILIQNAMQLGSRGAIPEDSGLMPVRLFPISGLHARGAVGKSYPHRELAFTEQTRFDNDGQKVQARVNRRGDG